jgi:hypothetical protein
VGIGRHPRLRVAARRAEVELHAEDLLHAILLEVHVLRRERRLCIDLADARIERMAWIGIEHDVRG